MRIFHSKWVEVFGPSVTVVGVYRLWYGSDELWEVSYVGRSPWGVLPSILTGEGYFIDRPPPPNYVHMHRWWVKEGGGRGTPLPFVP